MGTSYKGVFAILDVFSTRPRPCVFSLWPPRSWEEVSRASHVACKSEAQHRGSKLIVKRVTTTRTDLTLFYFITSTRGQKQNNFHACYQATGEFPHISFQICYPSLLNNLKLYLLVTNGAEQTNGKHNTKNLQRYA